MNHPINQIPEDNQSSCDKLHMYTQNYLNNCKKGNHIWKDSHDDAYTEYCSICEKTRPKVKPMGGVVSVKLTVDNMRSQIEQCLFDHADTIKASIQHELNNAIKNFDFELEVNKTIQQVLKTEIEQIVKQSVERAIRSSQWLSDWISESVKHELNQKKVS